MSRVDGLEQAVVLVVEVVGTLNRKSNPCPCCGFNRNEDREQYQMGVELDAIVLKLKRFAVKLGEVAER